MRVVRLTKILLRSNNAWLRILHYEDKSIFTSVSQLKEANPLENLNNSDEEEKTLRKNQQVKWHKTNLALFGPIIKEKKVKCKNSDEIKRPKRENGAQNIPLPIGLWNGSSVEIKLGKKGNHKVKKEKIDGDIQVCDSIKVPHIDAVPIDETTPSALLDKTITKEPNKIDGETAANLEKKKKERKPTKSAKKKTDADQEPNSPVIVPTTKLVELEFEEKLKVVEQDDHKPIREIVDVLPTSPYFVKNDVILPFPMILNKHSLSSSTKEIITVASAKLDVPSVTQVLNKTMSDKSEMMLALWRKRKIAEVGEQGLREFMRESKMTGKELHTSIETYLRGVEYSNVRVEPRISGHWLSMKSILGSLEDVLVLESYVVHPHLKYKGFVDCVARHKDNLVVIEWKTSQRTKATLEEAYDDPVQIAAYVGALNADAKYPFEVQNALLVVAYPTGRPADVLTLDRDKCEHYWNQWLKRLEAFNHLKSCSEKE